MTRKEALRKETLSIIRTMQFAINAISQMIESKAALYDITMLDSYKRQGEGLKEGRNFLTRLKEVKERQLEAKNKEI